MPPRGYNRHGGSKPIIQVQVKAAVSNLLGGGTKNVSTAPAPKNIIQLLFSGADPDIINNPKLQKQHVPDGWEAVTSIPNWATDGPDRHEKNRIKPTTLTHAIRLKGTNHILTSETKLTQPQLEQAAKDFKQATEAIGHMFPDGVAMHAPSAENFGLKNARGYMAMSAGQCRTFYISPRILKQDSAAEQAYRDKQEARRHANWKTAMLRAKTNGKPEPKSNDANIGWSMPAQRQHSANAYTMVHEMVHVLDDTKNHTGQRGQVSRQPSVKARKFFKSKKEQLSEYGRSNSAEGYAEAGAQWFLGGPGTSDVADDYAREYGWTHK